jgi:hypothetical protein
MVKFKEKKHLILIGPPGFDPYFSCDLIYPQGVGKTTIGKIIAKELGQQHFDVDDDLLEKYWSCPVSQKLKEVGDDRFIELEGIFLFRAIIPHAFQFHLLIPF